MAIRINLLAEEQAAEEMRRKDPVKFAIWIGSFLVAVVLLWILELQLEIGFSKNTYAGLEQAWKSNSAKYGVVTNNIGKTAQMERKLAALNRLATNRFFWAPVLNALQQTVIDDVQCTRLSSVQKYTYVEPRSVGTGTNKSTIPAEMIEAVSLSIDAKDYNPNVQEYNKFKERLCTNEFFAKSLHRRDGFVLDGTLSTPMAEPSDPGKQFVMFKLTTHFPEVHRGE